MKPPKTINIFGEDVKIIKKKNITNELGEHCDAFYNPKDKEIFIDDLTFHTLIHEMFHAMTDVTGVDQTDLTQNIKEILAQNTATFITKNFDLRFKRKK